MRLADLPIVTELVIRRAWLIERLEDLKRGNVVVSLGGQTIGGPGQASVSRTMGAALRVDIENNAQQLKLLGVELDDAEATAGLPTVRMEASHRLGPAR